MEIMAEAATISIQAIVMELALYQIRTIGWHRKTETEPAILSRAAPRSPVLIQVLYHRSF